MDIQEVTCDTRSLLVMGAAEPQWLNGFRALAASKGYQVYSYPLHIALSSLSVQNPYGVVVFDSGGEHTHDKLKRVRECTRYFDVPIVVLNTRNDAQSQLLAAGAHCQLQKSVALEKVMHEIESRADMDPVVEDLKKNVLQPFIDMAVMTFREMAQVELQVLATYQKRSYKMFGDVSAILGILGKSEGALTLSFPLNTVAKLTQRLTPSNAQTQMAEDESWQKDCVGELANIIAGQVRGLLADTPFQFNISTPTVVSGPDHVVRHRAGMPCLITVFKSEVGDFAMQICMAI